jgi:hypothetical protein
MDILDCYLLAIERKLKGCIILKFFQILLGIFVESKFKDHLCFFKRLIFSIELKSQYSFFEVIKFRETYIFVFLASLRVERLLVVLRHCRREKYHL